MLDKKEYNIGKLKEEVVGLAVELKIERIEKQAMDITCERVGDFMRLQALLSALHRIQEGNNELISGGLKEYKPYAND